jgi:NADH:ubiquinone oxidoreductase subunit F (NADH-binding)/NADH:ubiquinone oxidoreductase subunit E
MSNYLRRLADPESFQIAEAYRHQPEAVLEALRAVEARQGVLTSAAIEAVAAALRLPAAQVYGVATFYSMLHVAEEPSAARVARVCDGPVCWLKGAASAHGAIEARLGSGWRIERSSCLGLCDRAPAALIDGVPDETGTATPADDYAVARPGEVRVMLARAGRASPESLGSALEQRAYVALRTALSRPPQAIIEELEAARLTGRGGAGFPTGRKWRMVAQAERGPKYVVCNADESEPLIFKDRVLIDSDPHQLLEGMALAGYAVGANTGFIYIRGEYAAQAERLGRAIQVARAEHWLGDHIWGTDFSFDIHVHRGAGAYICGEESALLESLEGRRGEPRLRPPYPTTHGYHGLPTLVNNVETLSAVPAIIAQGATWWRGLSSAATPGTKLYTLLGQVKRPGLFEAPFGLTLRQIIDDFGGGMVDGASFQFALTGGAAGTLVPAALLDVAIDFASAAKGVSLGAGGILVCDQTVRPVALLRELLRFFEVESCGQCTPCRIGTRQAWQILNRLAAGAGGRGDLTELRRIAHSLDTASLCGLGRSAAIPLQSALAHFGSDFEAAEPPP